jgi:hypothetical protein
MFLILLFTMYGPLEKNDVDDVTEVTSFSLSLSSEIKAFLSAG